MKTNSLDFDAQALREKILDLAMRGKLVPQDPDDEPASFLLEKIKAEKAELIKEKKIKKSKPLPPITDDEKPFDIPDSWEWVRLGDVGTIATGNTPSKRKIEFYGGDIPFIKPADIQNYNVNYDTEEYLSTKGESKGRIVNKNDILITCIGNLGRNNVVNQKVAYNQQINSVSPLIVNSNLLHYFMLSASFISSMYALASATTLPILNKTKLSQLFLPLPPLSEQSRIAAKIAQLFALLRKVESSTQQYAKLQTLLKSKVLDLAMRGKLVKQNPDDEPASVLLEKIKAEKQNLIKEKKIKKTKPLPPITDDEKPFDIPDSWEWVRLGNIENYIQRGRSPKYDKSNKKHPIISQKCIQWDKISLNDAKFVTDDFFNKLENYRFVQKGDILWNSTGTGTVGRVNIVNHQWNQVPVDSHVTLMRMNINVNSLYVYYFLRSPEIQRNLGDYLTGTTKQKELGLNNILKVKVALPPLSEQSRIMVKIAQLFTFLGKTESFTQ